MTRIGLRAKAGLATAAIPEPVDVEGLESRFERRGGYAKAPGGAAGSGDTAFSALEGQLNQSAARRHAGWRPAST
jgi:hypothetical protein